MCLTQHMALLQFQHTEQIWKGLSFPIQGDKIVLKGVCPDRCKIRRDSSKQKRFSFKQRNFTS